MANGMFTPGRVGFQQPQQQPLATGRIGTGFQPQPLASGRGVVNMPGQEIPRQPLYPGYEGITTPGGPGEGDYLKEAYQIGDISPLAPGLDERLSGINPNDAALNQLRGIGSAAPGTSQWEQMMLGRQGIEEAGARDIASQRGAQQGQGMWNRLAMRGGLSGGGRERAAQFAGAGTRRSLQDVARAGQLDRAGIGLAGEDRRMGVLKGLPGMELGRAGFDVDKTKLWSGLAERDLGRDVTRRELETGRAIRDRELQNLNELERYKESMRAYAAQQTGKAIEAS